MPSHKIKIVPLSRYSDGEFTANHSSIERKVEQIIIQYDYIHQLVVPGPV